MFDFQITACDTDSVFFKKKNEEPFSEEEIDSLMKSLNEQNPSTIKWEMNGYFRKIITFKAKNYVMDDGKKIVIKGSALKDQKKEVAVKEMQQLIINELLREADVSIIQGIYHQYIKELWNISN